MIFLNSAVNPRVVFNVRTSNLSTDSYAMNLLVLLETYKPSFTIIECLVSNFCVVEFRQKDS